MGNKIFYCIPLLIALLLVALGCKKDRVAVKPLLIARVVEDTIFRDQETQNEINQTFSVQLHRDSVKDFQLIVKKSRY